MRGGSWCKSFGAEAMSTLGSLSFCTRECRSDASQANTAVYEPIFCDLTSLPRGRSDELSAPLILQNSSSQAAEQRPNFAQSSSPIFGDLQDPSFYNVTFEFGLAKKSFSEAAAEQKLDWASAEDSDTEIDQLSVDARAELDAEAPEQPSGFQGHSSRR